MLLAGLDTVAQTYRGTIHGVVRDSSDAVLAGNRIAQGNPGLGGGGPRVLQFAVRFEFSSRDAESASNRPRGFARWDSCFFRISGIQ